MDSIDCSHGHIQTPFVNQAPSYDVKTKYRLWYCSKCNHWYSSKEARTIKKEMKKKKKNASPRSYVL